MRIALAQINPTVGDIPANTRKALEFIRKAKDAGAGVVVFPELSIIWYPPKDLLLKPQLIDDNLAAVEAIATTLANHFVFKVKGEVNQKESVHRLRDSKSSRSDRVQV